MTVPKSGEPVKENDCRNIHRIGIVRLLVDKVNLLTVVNGDGSMIEGGRIERVHGVRRHERLVRIILVEPTA